MACTAWGCKIRNTALFSGPVQLCVVYLRTKSGVELALVAFSAVLECSTHLAVKLGYLKQTGDSETAVHAVFPGVVEILTKCRERDRDGHSTLTAAA